MCCGRVWYSICLSHNTSLIGCSVISLTPQSWQVPKQLLPPDTNIVGSHWTHICKHNQDRTARAKSRVIAQGFTQTFGVNYDETYAPVSRLASLRTICAIAARNDWPIHQMDIYNAYVNADFEEPIYMRQPLGYIQQSDQHVLKLKKNYVQSQTIWMSMVQVSICCYEQDRFYKGKIWCCSIL